VSAVAAAARQLAEAIDKLDAMKAFSCGNKAELPGNVHISWDWGSSTPGYKELCASIGSIVSSSFLALRAEAIQRQETLVAQRHLELSILLAETA
jgi:hypothetical protein